MSLGRLNRFCLCVYSVDVFVLGVGAFFWCCVCCILVGILCQGFGLLFLELVV